MDDVQVLYDYLCYLKDTFDNLEKNNDTVEKQSYNNVINYMIIGCLCGLSAHKLNCIYNTIRNYNNL